MVVVPAETFWMGSPENERGRYEDEGPRHEVRIAEPFAVGKYEVTFEEWDACVAGGGCNGYWPDDLDWGRGDRPAINVNWQNAKAYVSWLSREASAEYRLLTEAEWEYAARAGTTTRYHWGDAIGRGNANCDGCGTRWDDDMTAPVGSFAANAFGLHDILGNVWEWVEDCSHANYVGAPGDGAAWISGGDCTKRVMRGGSWYSLAVIVRSAYRTRLTPVGRSSSSGIRVARTLAP